MRSASRSKSLYSRVLLLIAVGRVRRRRLRLLGVRMMMHHVVVVVVVVMHVHLVGVAVGG